LTLLSSVFLTADIYQALRYNTLHSEDVAAAMFHAANWIAGIGRPEANRLAGEVFPHFPASDSSVEAQANAVVSIAAKPVAPYFNVVGILRDLPPSRCDEPMFNSRSMIAILI
jgi:hypothetical protein